MIELNNFSYSYKKGAEALKDVSAEIGSGIHILMGENGAGKTTLLHAIAGLLTATNGECLIDGKNVGLRSPEILSRVFLLGNVMSLPATDIMEMVRIHSGFFPTFDREMLSRNLEIFSMTGRENLAHLSFGNRQKAQIAYALALRTPYLLLDEPTNGLDISSKQNLLAMIAECVTGEQTVIVSTHQVGDLETLYDGILVLNGGRLIVSSSTDNICSRLSFTTAMNPATGCLYSEMKLGLYHSISRNTAGEFTDPDYVALYNALHNPNCCQSILNAINE